jgi:uncharacterized membrane protein
MVTQRIIFFVRPGSPMASKRPPIQFHLSTCVVLMFLAGGLIWLNVEGQIVRTLHSETGIDPTTGAGICAFIDGVALVWGWPLPMHDGVSFSVFGIVADLLLGLLILVAAGYAVERLDRNLRLRKQGPEA